VEDLEERAMALRALLQVAQADADHRLQGILYWKLTSDASLLTYEPFGVHIGCESSDPASALFPDFLDIAPFVPR
jgi:hypothetical protein